MSDTGSLLMGIVPLFVFVLVDTFSTQKTAIISALAFAFLELGLSLYFFGEIDWITMLSFALILVLGAISIYKKKSIHFKLQPAIFSFVFALTLIITSLLDQPIFLSLLDKYADQLPAIVQSQIKNPIYRKIVELANLYAGFALMAHGILTAWAAFKLSNWWWLALRGIGFYVFMFIAMFMAQSQVLSSQGY